MVCFRRRVPARSFGQYLHSTLRKQSQHQLPAATDTNASNAPDMSTHRRTGESTTTFCRTDVPRPPTGTITPWRFHGALHLGHGTARSHERDELAQTHLRRSGNG